MNDDMERRCAGRKMAPAWRGEAGYAPNKIIGFSNEGDAESKSSIRRTRRLLPRSKLTMSKNTERSKRKRKRNTKNNDLSTFIFSAIYHQTHRSKILQIHSRIFINLLERLRGYLYSRQKRIKKRFFTKGNLLDIKRNIKE